MEQINKRMLKILSGILLSIAFAYFAFKGVNFFNIYNLLLDAEYWYVITTFMFIVVAQILRSIRWGIILHPIQPLSQKIIFPITSIGSMLIILLPARLGELARPYLLSQNSGISLSTSLATIVLERTLDTLFVLVFMGIVVTVLDLPNWVINGALFIIVAMVSMITLLTFGKIKYAGKHFANISHKIFPKRFANFLGIRLNQFYDGMAVIGKVCPFLITLFLTACIWGIYVACFLLLFKAFHMQLGTFAALTILTLTALGISVPAGPGFIGNFHFFCILGLSIFGVAKEIALSYALVSHALVLVTSILLGLGCTNLSGLYLNFGFAKALTLFKPKTP